MDDKERGFGKLSLIKHTEGKRDNGKQRITNLTSSCQWMREPGFSKKRNIDKSYKGWKIMERHDRPRRERARDMKEENSFYCENIDLEIIT